MATRSRGLVKFIPSSALGVSEPPPEWFGNEPNAKKSSSSSSPWTNANWLKSRFHFSFAEYNNPANQSFGVLRVLNDDLVQPDRGFGSHPHRDQEICTYVVSGALTHQDEPMGTKETITRGAIQFMTAGKGIVHSERNLSATDPLRFIQIWIVPRSRSLTPAYGSSPGCSDSAASRRNAFAHLVSDVLNTSTSTPIKINQDANIHVAEIDAGKAVTFVLAAGRQAYLLCMEGGASVKDSGVVFKRHDAAELVGPLSFSLVGEKSTRDVTTKDDDENTAHVLIVEMAEVTGSGRKDVE